MNDSLIAQYADAYVEFLDGQKATDPVVAQAHLNNAAQRLTNLGVGIPMTDENTTNYTSSQIQAAFDQLTKSADANGDRVTSGDELENKLGNLAIERAWKLSHPDEQDRGR